MSENWQVGDLALAVGGGDPTKGERGGPQKGSVKPVAGVIAKADWVSLVFEGYPSSHFTRGWCSTCFRKILPDKHEDCEPEFLQLLKRSTRGPVRANNVPGEIE